MLYIPSPSGHHELEWEEVLTSVAAGRVFGPNGKRTSHCMPVCNVLAAWDVGPARTQLLPWLWPWLCGRVDGRNFGLLRG